MAAGSLPAPGTEFGPCENEECGHADCRQIRIEAGAICHHCGDAIGYERRFYSTEDGLVHAVCEEEAIDAEPPEPDDRTACVACGVLIPDAEHDDNGGRCGQCAGKDAE